MLFWGLGERSSIDEKKETTKPIQDSCSNEREKERALTSAAEPGPCKYRYLFNEIERPPTADVKFIAIGNSQTTQTRALMRTISGKSQR